MIRMDSRSERIRLFLTGRFDASFARLKDFLTSAGLVVSTWEDYREPELLRGLRHALSGVDGVVALLDTPAFPPAVLIEIGAAVGLGLPIVLVTPDSASLAKWPEVLMELNVVLLP